jgi:hypothetical protein
VWLNVLPQLMNQFRSTSWKTTLTFFNEATTTQTVVDGTLVIIDRNGTTTIYLNSNPASFADPNSFRAGTPVQVSRLHQQAIVNPATGTFTAVFENTILSAEAFTVVGKTLRLGHNGQAFRSTITGQLNATPPPTGYFAGYAVGAGQQ